MIGTRHLTLKAERDDAERGVAMFGCGSSKVGER
jgi:hypothetical protein